MCLTAPFEKVAITRASVGNGPTAGARVRNPEHRQLFRVSIGKRTKDYRAQNTKDRSIGTDTEAEDQYRKSSEARILVQRAQAIAQILEQAFDVVHAARVAALLLGA